MLRLVAYFIPVAIMAWALSWLADRPGSVLINWQSHEIEISVFHAVVMLALLIGLTILAWSIAVQLWRSPAVLGALFNRRRQVRGLDALSSGMIAIGAGDKAMATRYAVQARKSLPNEPLTHLLRAQAAQLSGDRTTARRIFESMLAAPETEQLGLRGLFLEAEREGEAEAARQFADRAVRLNPKLGWPVDALFELQCKERDWDGALETLGIARRNLQIEKSVAERRRAVLLTARAQAIEDSNPDRAMQLALEAHHLAHDLIPAAAIAGRILAARGHTKRAARVIERAWRRAPHPDLATVYAHARIGDSPHDRLQRVNRLASLNPHSIETPLAIAAAAIEAREWAVARRQLEPLAEERATQRVCTLMARIESEEHGDAGRVREWLARAVHAPRDAAWTADSVVSDRWAPVSPVTGALDAFQWRVPVSALEATDTAALAQKLDELVRLGTKTAAQGHGPGHGPGQAMEPALPHEAQPESSNTAPGKPAAPITRQPATKPESQPLRKPAVPERVAGQPARASEQPAEALRPAARGVGGAASRDGVPGTARKEDDARAKSSAPASTDVFNAERPSDATADRPVDRRDQKAESGPVSVRASKPIDELTHFGGASASIRIEPATRPAAPAAPADKSRADAATGNGLAQKSQQKGFLPPRAPDDPGLDPGDEAAKPRLEDAARAAAPAKRPF